MVVLWIHGLQNGTHADPGDQTRIPVVTALAATVAVVPAAVTQATAPAAKTKTDPLFGCGDPLPNLRRASYFVYSSSRRVGL